MDSKALLNASFDRPLNPLGHHQPPSRLFSRFLHSVLHEKVNFFILIQHLYFSFIIQLHPDCLAALFLLS